MEQIALLQVGADDRVTATSGRKLKIFRQDTIGGCERILPLSLGFEKKVGVVVA
jgi:hypothetical protein